MQWRNGAWWLQQAALLRSVNLGLVEAVARHEMRQSSSIDELEDSIAVGGSVNAICLP
jgi:hypothetical protein